MNALLLYTRFVGQLSLPGMAKGVAPKADGASPAPPLPPPRVVDPLGPQTHSLSFTSRSLTVFICSLMYSACLTHTGDRLEVLVVGASTSSDFPIAALSSFSVALQSRESGSCLDVMISFATRCPAPVKHNNPLACRCVQWTPQGLATAELHYASE